MLFHLTGDIPDPSAIGPYVADEIALARQLEDEGVILFAVKRAGGPGVFCSSRPKIVWPRRRTWHGCRLSKQG